jgi:hypothetical protein
MASKENMMDRATSDYEKWRETSGDYQSRFCFELVEINDRVMRLKSFIDNGCQGVSQQYRKDRLKIQLKIMEAYQEILNARYIDNQL